MVLARVMTTKSSTGHGGMRRLGMIQAANFGLAIARGGQGREGRSRTWARLRGAWPGLVTASRDGGLIEMVAIMVTARCRRV